MAENILSVIDGVQISEDPETGTQHFRIVDDPKPRPRPDTRNWIQKLYDWWTNANVRPYVRIRDTADPTGERRKDPFDTDAGSDGKLAGEIGIQIRF